MDWWPRRRGSDERGLIDLGVGGQLLRIRLQLQLWALSAISPLLPALLVLLLVFILSASVLLPAADCLSLLLFSAGLLLRWWQLLLLLNRATVDRAEPAVGGRVVTGRGRRLCR